MKNSTIYRFNTSNSVDYVVMKGHDEQNDYDVYNTIEFDFELFMNRLNMKKLSYDKLKMALIPNQDKDRKELCFIFDTNKIDDAYYGEYIFSKLLSLLDKESTYSILCGDYINLINDENVLFSILNEVIMCCNTCEYTGSNQFYLVYINRLTECQYNKIIENLSKYNWFIGYVDTTYSSNFKSYISKILCNLCVKNKDVIILAHPEDYDDSENVNMKNFPYEENGFKYVSINEESFNHFLSYTIETRFIEDEEVKFSFNALFPKFVSCEKLKLNVVEKKWDEYLSDKIRGKGLILEKIGFTKEQKNQFINNVYKKICHNYIYNLRKNEYGDLLFNVCVEFQTTSGNIRKTTIALKYIPENGEMHVVTIT